MAQIRVAQGDADGALYLLDEAERQLVSAFFPDVRPIPALMARVWIAQGRLSDALGWVRERARPLAINLATCAVLCVPLPVELHIVSASVFALLGALQFATGFRRRRPAWHRAAGRLVVICGLLVGLMGLWMTLFYPRPAGSGELLFALRLLFGSAMIVSLVLGFGAIRRGDVKRHRAWMARGYAIGLGAGTQMLTGMAGAFLISAPTELSVAFLMGAGWVINLAVAEWAIRRPRYGSRAFARDDVRFRAG
ncbi:MAG: DUF2306 domain-containing protein [Thermoflexales bacterium]